MNTSAAKQMPSNEHVKLTSSEFRSDPAFHDIVVALDAFYAREGLITDKPGLENGPYGMEMKDGDIIFHVFHTGLIVQELACDRFAPLSTFFDPVAKTWHDGEIGHTNDAYERLETLLKEKEMQ